ELGGGVDLGLEGVLALAEHGGGVERVTPGSSEEVGGAEEDGGAVVPVHPHPVVAGVEGGLDGAAHLGLAALVPDGEDTAVLVGGDELGRAAGLAALAADDGGDVDGLLAHFREPFLQGNTLGRAGGVRADGLVDRVRGGEDGVAHGGTRNRQGRGRKDTEGCGLHQTTRGTRGGILRCASGAGLHWRYASDRAPSSPLLPARPHPAPCA